MVTNDELRYLTHECAGVFVEPKPGFPRADIGAICAELLRRREQSRYVPAQPYSDARILDVWIESDPDEKFLIGIAYVADGTVQDCVIVDRAGAEFVVQRLIALLREHSPEVE